jgi:glyoxylase-like metal-dependent hydrolase (beta-lactamase superfamily II)
MIREGRLPAEIDQIDDLVIFHHHQDQTGAVDPVKNASSGMNQVEEALLLADRALTLAKGLDNHP